LITSLPLSPLTFTSKNPVMKNLFNQVMGLRSSIIIILLLITFHANAQRFRGKIEYYSSALSEFDGKIKSINDVQIEYYLSALSEFNGKVKSIGNNSVEYYLSAIPEFNGKIKSIGNQNVEYYLSALPGITVKIKSIGSINFEYNFSNSPKSDGKIKSIQNVGENPESEDALDNYYLIERLNRQ